MRSNSLAQHPLWLVAGLVLWGGCEIFSGVGDLHVTGGTGGGSGAGTPQGSGGAGVQHGPHGSNASNGGSGGMSVATGIGGSGGSMVQSVGPGVSTVGPGVSTVGPGPGPGSSVTGPGPSSGASSCFCGDMFCDPSCGEDPMNCPSDCISPVGPGSVTSTGPTMSTTSSAGSTSTGTMFGGPFCGPMGVPCPPGGLCSGPSDNDAFSTSCMIDALGFRAECTSDTDCGGLKCCGSDNDMDGWIDLIQCQMGCAAPKLHMCQTSSQCPNMVPCLNAMNVAVPNYRYCN